MTKSTKRTTVADLIAAAKVGAIDPNTEVVTAAAADRAAKVAANAVELAQAAEAAARAVAAVAVVAAPELPNTEHACGIAGCRHGSAHGIAQPDRQLKLQCPNCGAVARMTHRALARAGTLTCGDGGTFAVAARRTYTRRAQ